MQKHVEKVWKNHDIKNKNDDKSCRVTNCYLMNVFVDDNKVILSYSHIEDNIEIDDT